MKKNKESNYRINSVFAALLLVVAILALYFTNLSTYMDPAAVNTHKFIFENIGNSLTALLFVLTALAVTRQGSVYWVFISKKDRLKLDERQLKVRNRVYERSYKVLPLAALVATTFSNMNSGHMRTILWLTFLIGYFAVPVIVALQQKDS